jgi:hypothetical protein
MDRAGQPGCHMTMTTTLTMARVCALNVDELRMAANERSAKNTRISHLYVPACNSRTLGLGCASLSLSLCVCVCGGGRPMVPPLFSLHDAEVNLEVAAAAPAAALWHASATVVPPAPLAVALGLWTGPCAMDVTETTMEGLLRVREARRRVRRAALVPAPAPDPTSTSSSSLSLAALVARWVHDVDVTAMLGPGTLAYRNAESAVRAQIGGVVVRPAAGDGDDDDVHPARTSAGGQCWHLAATAANMAATEDAPPATAATLAWATLGTRPIIVRDVAVTLTDIDGQGSVRAPQQHPVGSTTKCLGAARQNV